MGKLLNQTDKNTNGITLIALIITIIILIILAGISISALTGSGLFGRAKEAEEKTIKAQIKEEIEMAIQEIQIDELSKGNNITLDVINKELSNKLDGIIITNSDSNGITGEYKGYEYFIDSDFGVTIREKTKGINFSYTLTPSGYTNGNIVLKIFASSSNGKITNIEVPESLTRNDDGTYIITKNGEYEFKITDSAGETKEQTINIEKIDKVDPLDFTITKEVVDDYSIKITAKTDDGEATDESCKSGIEKYVYNIKGVEYESTSDNYIIETPENGEVYVTAYDKAGNMKKSTNTLLVGKVHYVSTQGDDNNGEGTKQNAYASVNKAIETANSGDIIIIMQGTYDLTPMTSTAGYAQAGIYDMNKELLIYGENEKTILKYKGSDSTVRDGPALTLENPNTIVRNLTYVFEPKEYLWNGGPNIGGAIFRWCFGTAENVFFRITGKKKAIYLYNNDQGDIPNKVINCTFFHDLGSVLNNYTGRCDFINIATNVTTNGTNTNVITESFGTSSMDLNDLIKASKENEAFNTNKAGVYYGIHAWK